MRPSCNQRDECGTLGLDYNEITAVLVKAVQEQNTVIDDLRGGDGTLTSATTSNGSPANRLLLAGVAAALALSLLAVGVATRAANGPRATV